MNQNTKSEPTDIGIVHYKHARGSWQVGITNFWLRKRGVFTSVIAALLFGGTPWWAEKLPDDTLGGLLNFPEQLTISVLPVSAFIAVALAVFVLLLVLVIRANAIRSLERKEALHLMTHETRNALSELLSRTGKKKSRHDIEHERNHLISTSNKIAGRVAEFFQKVCQRNCIGCVIRLAQDNPQDGLNSVEYASVGRAGAIDATRNATSEPILANEGLPKLFNSKEVNCHGVVYIHSIAKAAERQIYKKTKNEENFPDDYSCIIAVPLNAWNGQSKSLIGILTITGRSKKHLLRVQNVDLVKAVGDLLALHYSAVFSRLSATDRMPKSFTQEQQD